MVLTNAWLDYCHEKKIRLEAYNFVLWSLSHTIIRPLYNNTVKVKVTLEQGTKAQRGVDVEIYPFFNLGPRWGRRSTPLPRRFTIV